MGASDSKEKSINLRILEGLSEDTRAKIEKEFKDQYTILEELREKHEQFKTSSSSSYHEVERQLIETRENLDIQSELATQYKEQVAEFEKKYGDSYQKLSDIQEQELEHRKQRDALQRSKYNLEREKRELSELIDTKNKEIDRLHDELKQANQRLNESQEQEVFAVSQKDQFEADFVKLEHKVSRLEQEKDLLTNQVQWLENSLKEKSGDLLNKGKEQAARMLDLQSALEERQVEVEHLQQQLARSRETQEELREQAERHATRLQELSGSQSQRDQHYITQLHTQEKLVNLYKKLASDNEAHAADLRQGAAEAQQLLRDAVQARQELEDLRSEDALRYDQALAEKDEIIQRLETELKNANDLLAQERSKGMALLSEEDLRALSPAAAAASRLLKSGMTLTQIYSEYVQQGERLAQQEAENKRLSETIDTIMADITEKYPQLKQQKENYEQLLETVDQLTNQLNAAVKDSEERQMQLDATDRRCGELTRENQRYKLECLDLATQVRMLLKEVEQARGTLVTQGDPAPHQLTSPAQNVISQKLVTFRSIEELQEQNQKLLALVRELGSQQEEAEQASIDKHTAQLSQKLEAALAEIASQGESRQRQMSLMEAVVRQRDMYKSLLAQTDQESEIKALRTGQRAPSSAPHTPRTPKTSASPGGGGAGEPLTEEQRRSLQEVSTALRELQAEFASYRKEKNENEKLLNEDVERQRSKCSELRLQASQLAGQLQFAEDRYKLVQTNLKSAKQEVTALTERNNKYSTTVAKLEQTVIMLREELLTWQQRVTKAEVQAEHLQQQCDTLRHLERQTRSEKEALQRERHTSGNVVASLNAIKNNLERRDFELKASLENQLEQLEKENRVLKQRASEADEQLHSRIHTLERQLIEAREQIGCEEMEHRSTASELRAAREQARALEEQVSRLEAAARAARVQQATEGRPHTVSVAQAAAQQQLSGLQSQLQQAQTRVTELTEEVSRLRSQGNQYRELADTMESSLAEANEAAKTMQTRLEEEVQAMKERLGELETQLETQEAELQRVTDENQQLSASLQNTDSGARQAQASLSGDLAAVRAERDAALSLVQEARAETERLGQEAQQAQDKYQRELTLHAADVSALQQAKEELGAVASRVSYARLEARNATEQLQLQQANLAEQKRLMGEERSRLQERVQDLQAQNDVLHDQLKQLGDEMAGLERRARDDAAETASLAERVARQPGAVAGADRSAQQLLQVIRFLRTEKDIAETQLAGVQAESAHYKQEAESSARQLRETSEALEQERAKAKVSVQTAAEHAELLRKVENLNVLHESNRLLRDERQALHSHVGVLEARVRELEAQLEPAQARARELESAVDALQADSQALRAEVDSWKARAHRVMEERVDPGEHERAVAEAAAGREQQAKLRAELSLATRRHTEELQRATNATHKNEELAKEVDGLKENVDSKNKEIEEKGKTILQLRNIGRKFRKQAEDAQKELDTLRKEQDDKTKGSVSDLQARIKALEEMVRAAESAQQAAEEKARGAEEAHKAAEEARKGAEEARKAAEEARKTAEEARRKAEERTSSAEQEARAATQRAQESERILADKHQEAQRVAELRASVEELEKQKEKFRQFIQGVKPKLAEQKTELDALRRQNEQLKAQLSEARSGDRATDAGVEEVRQELARVSEQRDVALAERDQLKSELESANKHISESKQRMIVTSSAQKAQSSPISAATESPKTVSIKPMTALTAPTSTTQIRMASIRPMAVSTPVVTATSGAPAVQQPTGLASQTPTATVHPTQQDGDAPLLQVVTSGAGGRPTQPVQAVSPHVDARELAPAEAEVSTSMGQEPSSSSHALASTPTLSASVSSSTQSAQSSYEVQPSTSAGVGSGVGSSSAVKRPREEADTHNSSIDSDHAPVKKTRTFESCGAAAAAAAAGAEVSQSGDSGGEEHVEGEAGVEAGSASGAVAVHVDLTSEDAASVHIDLDSDSTEQQIEVMESSEFGEESRDAPDQQASMDTVSEEVEAEDLYYAADNYSEGEEEIRIDDESEADCLVAEGEEGAGDEEGEDVDDTQPLEEEEEADEGAEGPATGSQLSTQPPATTTGAVGGQRVLSTASSGGSSGGTTGSQLSTASSLDAHQRLVPQTTQRTGAARSTLTPFALAGEHGDWGDDGCVPSTPTLAIPKRNDGFAEAVSSPQVPRQFVFSQGTAGGAEAAADFTAQLAAHGSLDSAYIDLAQLDSSQQQQQAPVAQPVTSSDASPQASTAAAHGDAEGETQQQVVGSTSSSTDSGSQPSMYIEGRASDEAGEGVESSEGGEEERGVAGESQERAAGASPVVAGWDTEPASKPRIEPIVWSDPGPSSSAPGPSAQPFLRQQNVNRYQLQGQPISTAGAAQFIQGPVGQQKRLPSPQTARRGTAFRTGRQSGGYRGGRGAHQQQPPQQPRGRGQKRGGQFRPQPF